MLFYPFNRIYNSMIVYESGNLDKIANIIYNIFDNKMSPNGQT